LRDLEWIYPEDLDQREKENTLLLSQPQALSGFQILKRTNTRLILRGHLDDSEESLVIKVFKRPHLMNRIRTV